MNLIEKKQKYFDKIITHFFKGHSMSKYKLLTVFSFLALLCFNIKAHAITENQYLVINKLINEENIDKAFADLKILQKNETKLICS